MGINAMTETKQTKIPKVEQCLLAFLKAGKDGINFFDAINQVHGYFSSCLNTDVSNLGKSFDLELARHSEAIPFRGGHTAHFMRYYLANADEVAKAVDLVNHFRKKRNADGLTDIETQYFISRFDEKKAIQQVAE